MTFLAVVLLLGAGGLFLARVLDALAAGGAPTPIPQLAAFAPWAVPVWAVLVVLGVAGREGVLLLVAAVALVVQVIWAVPPGRRVTVGDAGQPLTLVSVNALVGRADRAAILELVRRVGADVLVVVELTPGLAAELDPGVRGAGLVAADLHPAERGAGSGIWSRWPLAALGLLPSSKCAMPQVRVQPPRGPAVTVTAVHTQSPNPGRLGGWRADLAILIRTAWMSRATDRASDRAGDRAGDRVSDGVSDGGSDRGVDHASAGPRIFAGDFNATRDHARFRRLLTTGLTDAADVAGGWRPGFTWPSHLLPVAKQRCFSAARLDHVLVSREVEVIGVETVSVPGTDHRAVVARLRLPVPQQP